MQHVLTNNSNSRINMSNPANTARLIIASFTGNEQQLSRSINESEFANVVSSSRSGDQLSLNLIYPHGPVTIDDLYDLVHRIPFYEAKIQGKLDSSVLTLIISVTALNNEQRLAKRKRTRNRMVPSPLGQSETLPESDTIRPVDNSDPGVVVNETSSPLAKMVVNFNRDGRFDVVASISGHIFSLGGAWASIFLTYIRSNIRQEARGSSTNSSKLTDFFQEKILVKTKGLGQQTSTLLLGLAKAANTLIDGVFRYGPDDERDQND